MSSSNEVVVPADSAEDTTPSAEQRYAKAVADKAIGALNKVLRGKSRTTSVTVDKVFEICVDGVTLAQWSEQHEQDAADPYKVLVAISRYLKANIAKRLGLQPHQVSVKIHLTPKRTDSFIRIFFAKSMRPRRTH